MNMKTVCLLVISFFILLHLHPHMVSLSHTHSSLFPSRFLFSENVFLCNSTPNGSKYIFDSQTESSQITSQVLGLMKVLAPYCHISFTRLELIYFRMTELLSDHCNSKK